jgi:hypothetical protein
MAASLPEPAFAFSSTRFQGALLRVVGPHIHLSAAQNVHFSVRDLGVLWIPDFESKTTKDSN